MSDTDDTDDEQSVGGAGYYSHSHFCYTHQHWVQQAVRAGGFNVHCTQGAESAHKIVMHLASKRVRHLTPNNTQNMMLKYLCNHTTFHELEHWMNLDHVAIVRKPKQGLRSPLTCPTLTDSIGNKFLHSEIRLTEIEVANLVCQALSLPLNDAVTRERLKELSLQFSQQFVRQDGRTFWATDRRRDILRIKVTAGQDSLCGETVCFVSISDLKKLRPDNQTDSQTFCLIRYLQHHPDSWERDENKCPVCPGPFHVNNNLWQYAKTPSPRVALVARTGRTSRAFQRDSHMFGQTEVEQTQCRLHELHAWYALLQTDCIEDTMNMCPLFRRNSYDRDHHSWLETVTML